MNDRTYVAPVSFGLGDLIVSLPVIQAVIAEGSANGAETWLVARSSVQAALAGRICGLAGCVLEDSFEPGGPLMAGARMIDLRDHPLQRDHWWGSPEFENSFGPLRINDILERIGATFGINADFTRPVALRADPRPELSRLVLLVADSDGPSKRWPVGHWAQLAALIRSAHGDVRLLCRFGSSAVSGVDAIIAPTPGEAVDVLTSCRAVIGVDTGLVHLAVQQGTPTVTLSRAGNVFIRPWPHCRAVIGARCDPACIAADRARAYNERVDLRGFEFEPLRCPATGCCLDPIDPARVWLALQELW